MPPIDRVPERFAWRLRALRVIGDLPSFVRVALISRSAAAEVRVKVDAFGGETVTIRPGTPDVWTLVHLFPPQHMPPPGAPPPKLVWDLGANIGLSMAHMAATFPDARITGVELDHANTALCRRNVAPWSDRLEVIHAAVYVEEGEVTYHHVRGLEVGYRVDAGRGPPEAEQRTAPYLLLDELLARHRPGTIIDFVKMDIEGAEREVLRERTGWADSVRAIRVEVHPPYTAGEALTDLARLGFVAWMDPKPDDPGAADPITAIRPLDHPLREPGSYPTLPPPGVPLSARSA